MRAFKYIKPSFLLVVLLVFSSKILYTQDQTVGVFLNNSAAVNGYTLFSPVSSRTSFLIDNCGNKVNEWNFNSVPGMMAYLLEDGRLLRAGRIFNGFGAGGSGGLIEMRSWDDEQIWSFRYSDNNVKQHHDIEYLENGNILLIAWERKSVSECIQAGRIPESMDPEGLWFEHVVELKPVGTDQAEIVWEWHLFDHMIQDYDDSKDNFGIVTDHPERLDINHTEHDQSGNSQVSSPDWIHFNAIDYNPDLDLIVLSSRNTSEIYIIDHSTTRAEAASGEGGDFGKGGDLLFRWGNPRNFNFETEEQQQLFSQHDASWVSINGDYTNQISIFNNGLGRDSVNTSSVEILKPLIQSGEFVFSNDDDSFELEEHRTIFPKMEYEFSSPRISGVQILGNGNILISSGNNGAIYEISEDEELLWKYINPVGQIGSVPQGQTALLNDIFRSIRYTVDYPAFENRDLESMGLLELDPVDYGCEIFDNTDSVDELIGVEFKIHPNPAAGSLQISSTKTFLNMPYDIIDSMGRCLMTGELDVAMTVDIENLRAGIYYFRILVGTKYQVYKFVKF